MKNKKLKGEELALHQKFCEYGKVAKDWAGRCMLLLPEIERCGIWRKKGFGSIYEYAAKIAGLSHNQVKEGLRILKGTEDMPALRAVVEKKGINAVRPVVAIATQETAEFWAEKAENMSVNELKTYVRDFRNQANGSEGRNVPSSQPEKVTISMELDPQTAQQLEQLKGQGEWEEAVKEFLALRAEKFEREKPEPVSTESRHVPAEMERFVVGRDNHTCVYPGCCKSYDDLHHADGFARVKVHDPDRIFCLCKSHHALAHQGLIENEDMLPQFWRVREEPDRNEARFGLDQRVAQHKQLGLV